MTLLCLELNVTDSLATDPALPAGTCSGLLHGRTLIGSEHFLDFARSHTMFAARRDRPQTTIRPRRGIDVLRPSAQRADRTIFPSQDRKRIVRKLTHGIQMSNCVDFVIRQAGKAFKQQVGRVRPGAIGVRIVAFVADCMYTNLISNRDTELVVDKAREEV